MFVLAYAAWLLGIFAFFIPAPTWNPISRFNLTRAVVERQTLSVDDYVYATGDRAQVGGHWYSDKAPVVAFMAVPTYALIHATQSLRGLRPEIRAFNGPHTPAIRVAPNRAYQQAFYLCSLCTSGFSGVAVALLLFVFLRRRTTTQAAFLGSSLIVLGTPILPYATSLYGHVPAAALILGGVTCLDRRAARGAPTPARVRGAGACFALAAGAEYLVAVPVIVVLFWYLMRERSGERLKTAFNLALGGLIPSLLVALYLTRVFGAPWRTGYSFEDRPEFVAGHASGLMGLHLPRLEALYGLTFGTRRGLFYLAPITLIGAIRTFRMAFRTRDVAVEAGLAVLLSLLFLNAGYYMWWGGASTGPRHLIPGLVYLAVGIAAAFRSKYRWLRIASAACGVASVAVCLSATLTGIEAPEFGDALRTFVWPRLRAATFTTPNGATNLGLKLGLSPVASIVPLLAWLIGGYVYLFSQTRPRFGHARATGRAFPLGVATRG